MQNLAVTNTYLTVALKDNDAAKALGACWDEARRQWYVLEGRELVPYGIDSSSLPAFSAPSYPLFTSH